MTKVILITTLSLLAAFRVAGVPVMLAAPDRERATLALAPFAPDGGGGMFDKSDSASFLKSTAIKPAPAPDFDALVSMNRLDAVEFHVNPASTMAGWDAGRRWAVLRPAASDAALPDNWRADRLAVLNAASIDAPRPQGAQGRGRRERKLWPQRRPLREAQVWLSRKQP